MSDISQDLLKAKEKLSATTTALNKAKEKLSATMTALNGAEIELQKKTSLSASLSKEIHDKVSTIERLKKEEQDLVTSVEQKKEELRDVSEDLKAKKKETLVMLEEFEEKKKELAESTKAITEEVEVIKRTAIENAQKLVSDAQQQVKSMQSELQVYTDKVEGLKQREQSLVASCISLEQQSAELIDRNCKIREEMEATNNIHAAAEKYIASLEEKKNTAFNELEELVGRLDAEKTLLKEMQKQHNTLQSELEGLRAEKETHIKEKLALQESVEANNRREAVLRDKFERAGLQMP